MSLDNKAKESEIIVKRIDIRGEVCPMTFVLTKLALEELPQGSILEVLLDFTPATKNVPENCMRQDLAELIQLEELNPTDNLWLLKFKKS